MRQLLVAVFVALTVLSAGGCGGHVEKDKNKGLDQPKPASEK